MAEGGRRAEGNCTQLTPFIMVFVFTGSYNLWAYYALLTGLGLVITIFFLIKCLGFLSFMRIIFLCKSNINFQKQETWKLILLFKQETLSLYINAVEYGNDVAFGFMNLIKQLLEWNLRNTIGLSWQV